MDQAVFQFFTLGSIFNIQNSLYVHLKILIKNHFLVILDNLCELTHIPFHSFMLKEHLAK